MQLPDQDKKYFELAIENAKKAYKLGNYPVGAVLIIDDEVIGVGENKINEKKSYLNHAEMSMIIENAPKMYEASKAGRNIKIYSTLEPCIQCLGASVTNNVDEVFYIQKDPNGGACDLKHDNIGVHYANSWPKIYHCPYTMEPLDMMITFFKEEIKKGHMEWPSKMLDLYGVEY